MDLNEIKNRAKDLLADLTEPRPERDERPVRDHVDDPAAGRVDDPDVERVGERAIDRDRDAADRVRDPEAERSVDPAAQTDRLDLPAVEPVSGEREHPVAAPAGWEEPPVDDHTDDQIGDHVHDGVGDRTDDRVGDRSNERVDPPDAPLFESADPDRRVDLAPLAADAEPHRPADQGRHQLREAATATADGPIDGARTTPAGAPTAVGSVDSSVGRGPVGSGSSEPLSVDPSSAESDTSERLVTAARADSYSSRWEEVKGEFVDEPRQAVGKADALVGELLDELGQLFGQQRSSIERDLDNDDVSTEELRVALRRYRSFFDRLLSV